MPDIHLDLSPMQSRAVRCRKHITVLISGQGEGKSWSAVAAMLYHAHCHKKQIKAVIIRDKFTNIERNTIPTINKMLPGYIRWSRGGKHFECPELNVDLFGIDDMSSLSNLQGSESHFAWLEEPSPIYETGNAGLREEVFDVACSRGPREPGSWQRVFVTMNPSSEESWPYHRFIDNPSDDMEVIQIPYGENKYLPETEREQTKRAFAHRPDLYQRYVEGKFSFVVIGAAVTPEYREAFHRAKSVLIPDQSLTTYRFWDGGLFPTCVIAQVSPKGRLIIYDSLRGDNIGMMQFVTNQVLPTVNTKYNEVPTWVDTGDLNIANRDQSNSDDTAAKIIEDKLKTSFRPGPVSFTERREAIKELLSRSIEGGPMLLLSRNEGLCHQALRGGWHYSTSPSGKKTSFTPEKDIHSHPGDALATGVAEIFKFQEKKPTGQSKMINKIASSYVTKRKSHTGIMKKSRFSL